MARTKGEITTWNDGKGYGFITPASGNDRVFIHISAFPRGVRRPEIGDAVSYRASRDRQGRLRAKSAALADEAPVRRRSGRRWVAISMALLFLASLFVLVETGRTNVYVLSSYLVLSSLAFLFYGADKVAARHGDRRISEAALLTLGLLGGWPGAILAQELIRHKSSKQSFRLPFWATVILNCLALAWLSNEDFRQAVRQLISG